MKSMFFCVTVISLPLPLALALALALPLPLNVLADFISARLTQVCACAADTIQANINGQPP